MAQLTRPYDVINLAQGFPDFDPPAELIEAAVQALRTGHNQYASTWGSARFRQALAAKQSHFSGMEIDPDDITVTCGGTEAMMASIQAICDPGDRVIIFSPYYESYAPDAQLCGAIPVYVSLDPPDFALDPVALRQAFQGGAKALVLCNPSNPSGKVFSPDELQTIADLAHEYDAFVIADEVYEHIVYPPHHHTYLSTLPGMLERTISCGSMSKTYSITGWRLGYTIAPPEITRSIRKVHDFLTVCVASPLQEAAVAALTLPDAYYTQLQADYTRRLELFLGCLDQTGLGYLRPQGGCFVLADISTLGFTDDVTFCLWLAREIGVTGLPCSSFFSPPVHHLVRFNIAKRDETLVRAGERLQKIKERL
jgi:aspartate/methionine/tyrosine aminotransferase